MNIYDYEIGCFITEDTYQGELGNPLSLNLYTYVENNPLSFTDPSGMSPITPDSIEVGEYGKGNSDTSIMLVNALMPYQKNSKERTALWMLFIGSFISVPHDYYLDMASGSRGSAGGPLKGIGNLPSTINYTSDQLKKKFKHADDFGVSGNYNPNNANNFMNALDNHIKNADNVYSSKISGVGDVYVYIKDKNLAVFTDKNGNFVSGWRLSQGQLDFHTKHFGTKIK